MGITRLCVGLVALLLSLVSYASGQRSLTVTAETLGDYPVISLDSSPHTHLRYVGSSAGRHLLMTTKTSISKRADGRPGMPFDSTFAYTIPSDVLKIENGWDISERLKARGINIRPANCPGISLNPRQSQISLPNDPALKMRCISGVTSGVEYF